MRLRLTSLIVMFMTVSLIVPAFAYLDPGTGSMILQATIAAIAGGITFVSVYYYRLKSFFLRKFSKLGNEEKSKK